MASVVGSGPDWVARCFEFLLYASSSDLTLSQRVSALAQMVGYLDRLYVRPDAQNLLELPNPHLVEGLLEHATRLLEQSLLPALRETGIRIEPVCALDSAQLDVLQSYFASKVYPLLTPLAVDPGRPFPYISSDSLNLLVELRKPVRMAGESTAAFARVKVPRVTPRLIRVASFATKPASVPAYTRSATAHSYGANGNGTNGNGMHNGNGSHRNSRDPGETNGHGSKSSGQDEMTFVWSADVVRYFVTELFAGMPVQDVHLFRVLRAQGNERPNEIYHRGVARRHDEQPVVRLDVCQTMPERVLAWLMHHLRVQPCHVVEMRKPLEALCLENLAELAMRVPEGPASTSR